MGRSPGFHSRKRCRYACLCGCVPSVLVCVCMCALFECLHLCVSVGAPVWFVPTSEGTLVFVRSVCACVSWGHLDAYLCVALGGYLCVCLCLCPGISVVFIQLCVHLTVRTGLSAWDSGSGSGSAPRVSVRMCVFSATQGLTDTVGLGVPVCPDLIVCPCPCCPSPALSLLPQGEPLPGHHSLLPSLGLLP